MTTKTRNLENPAIYVGTYKKYNNGSIQGAWFDLTKFDCLEDFIEACEELHNDEDDPELMYQDFENFPKELYSESSISESLFDYINLNDSEREILDAYLNCIGGNIEEAMDKYEDAYYGTYESFSDFCFEHFNDTTDIPAHLDSYIDYDRVERDYYHDFSFEDGHVFFKN